MTSAKHVCCRLNSPGPAAASAGAATRGRFVWSSSRLFSAGPALFALLLPKCPLCLAAWAAALGVGAAGQRYLMAPLFRPALLALLLTPLLLQLAFAARPLMNRLHRLEADFDDHFNKSEVSSRNQE